MKRTLLVIVGSVATALAVAGAILPGLPATPFVLVALWAFSRSSERLHDALHRVPLLGGALDAAARFEERRAIRPGIKAAALAMAWGSVTMTAIWSDGRITGVLAAVVAAALMATFTMWWIPTDRSP